MAPEPISTAYFSLCLYVYLPIVAKQRLSKNVTAETNTQAEIECMLNASSSMRLVSYKRKVGENSSQNFLFFS
jgi:hypothetical protein